MQKLILKKFTSSEFIKIRWANNNNNADLWISGRGPVKIGLNDNSTSNLDNVICAKAL